MLITVLVVSNLDAIIGTAGRNAILLDGDRKHDSPTRNTKNVFSRVRSDGKKDHPLAAF